MRVRGSFWRVSCRRQRMLVLRVPALLLRRDEDVTGRVHGDGACGRVGGHAMTMASVGLRGMRWMGMTTSARKEYPPICRALENPLRDYVFLARQPLEVKVSGTKIRHQLMVKPKSKPEQPCQKLQKRKQNANRPPWLSRLAPRLLPSYPPSSEYQAGHPLSNSHRRSPH